MAVADTVSVITMDDLNRSQNGLGPGGRKSFQFAVEKAVGANGMFVRRLKL